MADKTSGYGIMSPKDMASDFAMHSFLVTQILMRVRTVALVKVEKVEGLYVTVKPLVKQVDGKGNATPHGTIFNIPFWRLQGGGNAVMCDPEVGDIGYMGVADRDISAVKTSKAESTPGSSRVFDLADGIYFGGLLNGGPTQYVKFKTGDSIEVLSPDKVTVQVGNAKATLTPTSVKAELSPAAVTLTTTSAKMELGSNNITIDAAAIHLNGPVIFNGIANGIAGTVDFGNSVLKTTNAAQVGSVASAGDVVGSGKSLATHTHGGVTVGGGTSGPPT